ncbi:MAG: ABC transporter permease [Defluviitaleaceae bacterium]|nr:ABC transporter permease [Defluviitaleaceae bacterium]
MIGFLLRKIWKTKWLMLCLVLGNVILVGVVTAAPLFTAATMQRILQEDLRNVQETQNTFPAMMQLRYNFNAAQQQDRRLNYISARDSWWPHTVAEMGVPGLFEARTYVMSMWFLGLVEPRELPDRARTLQLIGAQCFEDNIRLTHGRMPSEELVDGNIIEALAMDWALHSHNLLMGELMEKRVQGGLDKPIFIRIVGLYEIADGSDAYWSAVPITFNNSVLISPDLVYGFFIENYIQDYRLHVTWTQVLDHTAMQAALVPYYQEAVRSGQNRFNNHGDTWRYTVNFYDTIVQHTARTEPLGITIWVLQAPIYVMLALFMYMVTKQILLLDKNDISILKSRGASRLQIMGIYAGQGLIVGIFSFPLGLGLGIILCHIIGASNGFLDMVYRTALDVEITGTAVFYGIVGSVISYLYMLLPVINLSRVSIIEHKQGKTRRNAGKPIWERYCLDILAFGASIYVMYNFHSQRELMMATLPEARSFDPLIFLSSSLFIIGAGLLCLRLYPYLVKLILLIGRSRFNPSIYASMLKVIRSGGQEQFIMLFLVFTVAVGTFSAQAARTINLDNAHRIQYLAGADLMIGEPWADNIPGPASLGPPPVTLIYTEPDFNRFTHFDEVDAIARVMMREVSLRMGASSINDLTFMAIDTQSFGETAWFRDDLLMIHINYFLNALSRQPDGVLLSSNFQTELGYSIGDVVTIIETPRMGIAGVPPQGRFTVVGFVDYWPTFVPIERAVLATGEVRAEEQFLAVTNLGHITTTWGARPYQIWMRTNTESHQFIYDFISENDIRVAQFYDTSRSLVEIQLDPIVQSTNGVLTISFIMTLLLCFTGFLIYWILSIKGRLLQFGVFRAMGMGMRGIMGILLSEQALITLSALAIGGVIGEITARFFVPLLQLSYTAADQVIPLLIAVEFMDYITLYGLLGFMIVICIAALAVYTSRVDVSQILKLGED